MDDYKARASARQAARQQQLDMRRRAMLDRRREGATYEQIGWEFAMTATNARRIIIDRGNPRMRAAAAHRFFLDQIAATTPIICARSDALSIRQWMNAGGSEALTPS